MKSNWIRTDRLWCLFLILAVSQVTESSTNTINQVKLPIPTKESLPQVAEELKAAVYLENVDELEKNFEGQRNSYKRLPRKLGTSDLDGNLEYQGVVGRPGVDFPILPSIPRTDFSCRKVKKPGYYADLETDCQVFHICDNGRKVSFLCPNGTIFRQSHLICDWWFRVDCERSIELYEESAEQLATDQRIFKERSEALSKAMLKVQTTPQTSDRVVTERSFGPSTTIFNSESKLPERARYFSGYSKDENQVPAETGSFAGNQYQTNFNNYYPQSKTLVGNWNQGNLQSGNYQTQSSTTAQPAWNQVVDNNHQGGSYQDLSTTTTQPSNVQGVNNNFQSNYQPQYTTSAQSIQNEADTSSQVAYQPQPTTVTSQSNWNQGSNNYQPGNFQTPSTTAATQTNWNNQGSNGFRTENYQSYTPTTKQTNWNQESTYQPVNYQTPSSTATAQTNWNNANVNNFQTENHQASQTTPTPMSWNNQGTNNFGSVSYQKQVTNNVEQNNWNQAVNNLQSNSYQSLPVTTVQPDWNQESDTIQPGLYQSQQSYQQPTTIIPDNLEQIVPAKESQVLAESASFVGHQNAPRFNFQPENYYTQAPQTNSPLTTYPVTSLYSNDYSPSGAFSFVEYQRSPDTLVARYNPTQATPITTTVLDYSTVVGNSTLPPSGETLIPNMINSLQTLTDNNVLFDTEGQNAYSSQTNTDDELNSVALYFNNLKNPQVTTVASDLQFNYYEHTSRTYNDGSSVGIESVETTTPVEVEGSNLPAVLTQNTKEAYDKLFKNDTNTETTTTVKSSETSKPTPTSTSSANLSFAQGLNLNRSSAELRELAAVFTRALTAYLDDPENFRKILAEVRPTEPPSVKPDVTEEQEVLDFSDDSKKSHRNKLTEPSTTSPNLAAEINGMTQHHINADLSTIVPQYTTSPLTEITSKYTETPQAGLQEYALPADSEQLQVAGSQSFYSSRDNSIITAKTPKPATSTLAWTVSPLIDTEQEFKDTSPPPVYFTTAAENLETTVIVQRAKEMFSHLNASEAGQLMNVMKTAPDNETVKRLVLLLVNDPNKENSPEQTRNNIIEALLDHRSADGATDVSESSTSAVFLPPSSTPGIPFGQRLQEDGSPIPDGHYKKLRKGTRRRVVHRSRSVTTSTEPTTSDTRQVAENVNGVGPGLSSDSDSRAVELLKSLYSIASKWS